VEPITAVAAGVLVILTNVVTALFSRRKNGADTAEVLTGIAMRQVEQMETRITDLEQRLTRSEERERLALDRERVALLRIEELLVEIRALRKSNADATAAAAAPPLEVHLVHEPANPEVVQ
jgi:hypothetical protein